MNNSHDLKVLIKTIRNSQHNFPMPPLDKYSYSFYLINIIINSIFLEKYYLVDATYTHEFLWHHIIIYVIS